MAASFTFVLSTLERQPSLQSSSPNLGQATQIRQFSNELLRLTGKYLSEVPRSEAPNSDQTEAWLSSKFRPSLNDLRQRMMANPNSSAALAGLLAASDRVAAMAVRPSDIAPRGPAANAVLDACVNAERTISAMGLQRKTAPPAIVPGFKRFTPSRQPGR